MDPTPTPATSSRSSRAPRPWRAPDWNLRLLFGLATVAWIALWISGVAVLLGLPLVRALADESASWHWSMPVEVRLTEPPAPVLTAWGVADLDVDEVRAGLRLPIPQLPWWMVGVLWLFAAVGFALMLAFVHQIRVILTRAREGAPFARENARGIERLALLSVALAVAQGISELATAAAVRAGLADPALTVPIGLPVDGRLIVLAAVLFALAGVFRRGADLEHEQSLVV